MLTRVLMISLGLFVLNSATKVKRLPYGVDLESYLALHRQALVPNLDHCSRRHPSAVGAVLARSRL